MHEDEVLFTEFFNQRLKERGLTLKHLSDTTGIAIKHLESFGHGRFEHLPSAPYLRGYFMKLGPIMGFEPDEWWNRIKSEDSVHKSGARDRMPANRFSRIRGRALIWGGAAIVLILLYIGARFTTILGEPQLMLTAPAAAITSVAASDLAFQGMVRNGNTLAINGANVPLGQDGSFNTDVTLQPGPNTIELQAKKTLGRTVTLTRQIYYDDSQTIVPGP
jgi:hypothetical protein